MIQYIENWADGVIVRNSDYAKIKQLAQHAGIPVINAMTSENHPCKIVSDLYSIRERKPNYRDLTYTFVGPSGNISRSWMHIAAVMDLKFNHICALGNELCQDNRNYIFHTELDAILGTSDVILTDSIRSEYQTSEYMDKYQITLERLQQSPPHAMLNPCPPFFRGEEVSGDAIDWDYFVGYAFKKNLLYVQQAIILSCCGFQEI